MIQFMSKNDTLDKEFLQKTDEPLRVFLALRKHFTIRDAMLRIIYPFPNSCKTLVWLIACLICLGCMFWIIVSGIALEKEESIAIDPALAALCEKCPEAVT